ncbi:MAG: hypothetical protein MSG64_18990 [Pyrinomonadaceae bacterium MAG19_C2-C3]|nr:hypothetical protein [Pyrinomonadaceae bacterium MAG19_C2-C3]
MNNTTSNTNRNNATQADTTSLVVRFIVLPTLLLIVTLLGGVRVDAATRALVFLNPPLIALILAALVMSLYTRAKLINIAEWFESEQPFILATANALTLIALFFATAQVFNVILPERGLLHGLFAAFFLWTLFNNLFAAFDARRALRSVIALLAIAFMLKYLLLANLAGNDEESGLLRQAVALLLKGVTLGTLDLPRYAATTGYLAFFAVAFYVVALWLMPETKAVAGVEVGDRRVEEALAAYLRLTPSERLTARGIMGGIENKADDSRALHGGETVVALAVESDEEKHTAKDFSSLP